jgi:tripartite-type tricarboxylate transporter receptor subunit TctC
MNLPSLASRILRTLVPALGVLASVALAQEPAYPTAGSIKIIVPVAAGGTVDLTTRALAAKLTAALGQTVLVENRTGGSGVPAALSAIHARPDGHTLFMGTIGTVAVNPFLMHQMPYDPQKDLVPVSLVADVPGVLVVNPSVPVKTVSELIAYAKSHPGKLNYGSPGNGTSPHLAAELFKQKAGVDMVHIPYSGASKVMVDLLGGKLDVFFDNIITSLPYIKAGKLRALAVTGAKRSEYLPQLPTIQEAGLPGYAVTGWMGLMAPAGTPPAIVQRLSAEVQKIADEPEMKNKVVGAVWTGSTPEEYRKYLAAEIERWTTLIRTAQLQVE